MKRGFTLIELLVVVLIIGILAAVAWPQYNLAIHRSRYATLKNITNALAAAQELYYLEHGTYATSMDDLDLNIPGTGSSTVRYGSSFACYIEPNKVYCTDKTPATFQYRIYLKHIDNPAAASRRECLVMHTNDLTDVRNKICQTETGKTAAQAGIDKTWNLINYSY